jgi:hypothetical protein
MIVVNFNPSNKIRIHESTLRIIREIENEGGKVIHGSKMSISKCGKNNAVTKSLFTSIKKKT